MGQSRQSLNSNRNCTTIERLQECTKCPNKFRIRARVIEFDPLDLVDALILFCANCKKEYAHLLPLISDNVHHFC